MIAHAEVALDVSGNDRSAACRKRILEMRNAMLHKRPEERFHGPAGIHAPLPSERETGP
jgi:hypothetical protein